MADADFDESLDWEGEDNSQNFDSSQSANLERSQDSLLEQSDQIGQSFGEQFRASMSYGEDSVDEQKYLQLDEYQTSHSFQGTGDHYDEDMEESVT